MHFFFSYIYYRITQFMFKKDGRTGGSAIVLISLTQTFLIALILTPIEKCLFSKQFQNTNYKQFGWLGGGIFVILFILNYKKYDGSYNKYRSHWSSETSAQRIIKGILVIMVVILPIILFGLLNTRGVDRAVPKKSGKASMISDEST